MDRVNPASLCHSTGLRKATRRISQLYDSALAPCGLKSTQRAILVHIARSEPCTVGALASALVMDAGGLAHTLKPLDRDGFVTISVDPVDKRNRLVQLTPTGRAKLAEATLLWEAAHRSFETAFGAEESASLREALRVLVSGDFAEKFERALKAG